MTDIAETIERLQYNGLTIPLHSPSDGDYLLGDANNGVTIGQGNILNIHQHAGSVTDGLDITIHNVTRGTSATVNYGANTYEQAQPDLYFGERDELAIEVTGTTDATDGYLLVEVEADDQQMGVTGD